MELPGRHIIFGTVDEFLFFAGAVGKPPAWFIPLFQQHDVDRIPVGSTVILYGSYTKNKVYPLVEIAWESKLIETKVITPNEITT